MQPQLTSQYKISTMRIKDTPEYIAFIIYVPEPEDYTNEMQRIAAQLVGHNFWFPDVYKDPMENYNVVKGGFELLVCVDDREKPEYRVEFI